MITRTYASNTLTIAIKANVHSGKTTASFWIGDGIAQSFTPTWTMIPNPYRKNKYRHRYRRRGEQIARRLAGKNK